MAFDPQELHDRLDALNRRVAALERRVDQIAPPRVQPSLPKPPEVQKAADSSAPPVEPVNDAEAIAGDAEAAAREARKREAFSSVIASPSREQLPEPAAPFSLERLVGGRVFGIAGAFVVIIGVVLALKLAWDSGWLDLLPNGWKCIISALFGAALLGVGELARRKWGALASIGCSVAGVGVLYATSYAAYGAFGLVSHQVGFAMLVASAAVGVAVGARANLASIAGLSLVAGYGVPLFFLEIDPEPIVLPTYLLALLACGLALSGWRGGHFMKLRTLCWWFTMIFGAATTLAVIETPYIGLTFVALAWLLVHSELITSASKAQLTPTKLGINMEATAQGWRAMRALMCSFGTTAWAALLAALVLDYNGFEVWFAPAAGFVVTALAALTLGGHLRVVQEAPETDLERLAGTFAAQSGALLIATIALALTGHLEVVAWLAMGLAAAGAGLWMCARPLAVYGAILLAIATGRLLIYDWLHSASVAQGFASGGLVFTPWTGLAAAAAATWLGLALMLRAWRDQPARWLALTATVVMSGLCYVLFLHQDAEVASLSAAWLGVGGILFCAHYLLRGQRLDWCGLVGVALAGGAWFIAYPMEGWSEPERGALVHPGLWHGLIITLGGGAMGTALVRCTVESDRALGVFVLASAGLLALVTTSLEVARVAELMTDEQASRRAAVSIWWGLCAVGLLIAGFVRTLPPVRHVGLGLLAVATAKAVIFDLAGVDPMWRVASFLSLGALMLGVGLVYARVSARIATDPDGAGEGEDPIQP